MYKKWKSVAALGMAVLIGCMMPVDTMIVAAEENQQEIEVDSVSDNDAVDDDGAILDGENTGDEENVDDGIIDDEENVDDEIVDDDNVGDETDADADENTGDEVNEEDENADDEVSADEDEYVEDEVNTGNDGIALMSEAEGIETRESNTAPVINIMLGEERCTYSLGGEIEFKYVNNSSQAFKCSASQDDQPISFSYYLDKVEDTATKAKGEAEMNDLAWQSAQSSSESIPLSSDARYVLYVKVEAGEQTTYACSRGVVVDTKAPMIVEGVVNGGTYPEGTEFHILDTNLESVKVNGTNVSSEWNTVYRVSANGTSTSCVIWAKDKAGNEMTCSINVSRSPAENVISASGIYSLTAGTSYQLAAGQWQVGGDKSVYSGGSTFYVKEDGDYTFTKR